VNEVAETENIFGQIDIRTVDSATLCFWKLYVKDSCFMFYFEMVKLLHQNLQIGMELPMYILTSSIRAVHWASKIA
jgi:hypothetical protein